MGRRTHRGSEHRQRRREHHGLLVHGPVHVLASAATDVLDTIFRQCDTVTAPGSILTEVFRVSRCLLRPDLYDDLGCARIGRRGHGGDPLPGESLDTTEEDDKDKAEALEQKVERGKAMVIFTDGGDTDAETLREGATARELGIAVSVVGVGTVQGGVVYDVDYEGRPTAVSRRNADGTPVISKGDDASMKLIAQAAGDGSRYVVASETGEVDPMPVVDALRAVNRGLATKQVDERHDIFQRCRLPLQREDESGGQGVRDRSTRRGRPWR